LAAATPVPEPTPEFLPAPVRIQIPSLDINRFIIPLAQKTGQSVGTLTWNTKKLFRSGHKDRIGHSEGSANPGEEGNMILVGDGQSGVFVRLKRLKLGHQVHVINDTGETFTYEVETIKKVKLRRKNSGDSIQHLSFLSAENTERLTLVGCSSAGAEPCSERVYVVAQPVE
jgi:LPXTG-site transpeptidase (sortase) family protein